MKVKLNILVKDGLLSLVVLFTNQNTNNNRNIFKSIQNNQINPSSKLSILALLS